MLNTSQYRGLVKFRYFKPRSQPSLILMADLELHWLKIDKRTKDLRMPWGCSIFCIGQNFPVLLQLTGTSFYLQAEIEYYKKNKDAYKQLIHRYWAKIFQGICYRIPHPLQSFFFCSLILVSCQRKFEVMNKAQKLNSAWLFFRYSNFCIWKLT